MRSIVGADATPSMSCVRLRREEFLPGRAGRQPAEHFAKELTDGTPVHVPAQLGQFHAAELGLEIRKELQLRIHAGDAKQPARDGAEERAREGLIGYVADPRIEVTADLPPKIAVACGAVLKGPHLLHGIAHVLLVELDALYGIALQGLPVAQVEAIRRAPGDSPERGVVPLEGCHDHRSRLVRFGRGDHR